MFLYPPEAAPSVLRQFEKLSVGDAAISVITDGELFYGTEHGPAERRQANRRLRAELIDLMPVLPMPYAVGEAYGLLREALERGGQMIGNNDLWIAAHAKAEGLILITNNEREFKRVSGLRIESWVG